jgi:hypothetical protein
VDALNLFETATGQPRLRIRTGPFGPFAFSPDSHLLATAGPDALHLWEVASGQELFRRAGHEKFRGSFGPSFIDSLAFFPDGRSLATGLVDGTILVWGLVPEATAAPATSPRELDQLWTDLAGADGTRAYRAVHLLAGSPARAIPFLKEHLRPVAAVDPKRVERLLADLDSAQFTVRTAAAEELAQSIEQIEPRLRRVLEGQPSAEVRKRVDALLAGSRAVPTGPTLRVLRAIWVLERIGTPEAKQALHKLAGGAPARETREAREALERLAHRAL